MANLLPDMGGVNGAVFLGKSGGMYEAPNGNELRLKVEVYSFWLRRNNNVQIAKIKPNEKTNKT